MSEGRRVAGSGTVWTPEDVRELLRLHSAGVSAKDIGRKLKREWGAIASKVNRMRRAGEKIEDQRRKNVPPVSSPRKAALVVPKPSPAPASLQVKVVPTTLEERAAVGLRALGWHVRDVAYAMDWSLPATASVLEALGG